MRIAARLSFILLVGIICGACQSGSGHSTAGDPSVYLCPGDGADAGSLFLWVAEDGSNSLESEKIALSEINKNLQRNGMKVNQHFIISAPRETNHTVIVAVLEELGKGGYTDLEIRATGESSKGDG
jgi:biopolymer transport protein ExbD